MSTIWKIVFSGKNRIISWIQILFPLVFFMIFFFQILKTEENIFPSFLLLWSMNVDYRLLKICCFLFFFFF